MSPIRSYDTTTETAAKTTTGSLATVADGKKRKPGSSGSQKYWKSLRSSLRRDQSLYLLALPGLLFFILFKYVPMWGVLIAFQNYFPFKGMLGSEWVGFAHFARFFAHSDFILLFRNTLAISLLNLLLFFSVPIIVALCLNELRSMLYKRIVQTVIYMPHFLSWVIIAGLTFLLLGKGEGLINAMLEAAGRPRIDFLTNPDSFWMLVTLQAVWKEGGWGTIVFLAAIAGIDPQIYEAARVDGAGRLRQIWHITLPGIRGVIVILLILRLGDIMDVGFEQIFLMYNGAVSEVAEVFDTYVYRVGIQQGQFSYSTAVGLFKSVIGLILVLLANKLAKRMGEDGVY
ncbi:putative aldouronate transport system permease protein [Paenibacillus algorifonticola]|uniref:Putative aldouronate transport system permease protein n=1 Tax=Paenibacillus algorifonticola TaxID=684063 RepID=A0A1I2HB77_9BACL|nr:ABC transporter permease subunit [Paenibacillus algorifonticola]SFF26570.1 putative aldouronate transport system permease protein [Paenibacillus algorifonticola]